MLAIITLAMLLIMAICLSISLYFLYDMIRDMCGKIDNENNYYTVTLNEKGEIIECILHGDNEKYLDINTRLILDYEYALKQKGLNQKRTYTDYGYFHA